VTLTAPSSAGSYQVTAQFAGDSYFLPSTGSIMVDVVSTAKIKVNLQLVAYKVVNVQVDILQGSTVVATRLVTLTPWFSVGVRIVRVERRHLQGSSIRVQHSNSNQDRHDST
jgi:hypothetical protein